MASLLLFSIILLKFTAITKQNIGNANLPIIVNVLLQPNAEMKSINLNMLNQLTQMNQEQITKKKLMEEQVKRDTEKSYKSLKGK